MSVSQEEENQVLFDPADSDAAFATLMDVLAPEEGREEDPQSTAETGTASGAAGLPASETEGTGNARVHAPPATEGAGGDTPVPGAAEDQPTGTVPGEDEQQGDIGDAGTLDAVALEPRWAEMSAGIEENMTSMFQDEALTAVQEELPKYFEALRKHPRALVGSTVPSVSTDGDEQLRDSEDAKEWQEAVRHLLVEEVNSRATAAREEVGDTLETLHASVDLFRNNHDLIPGTKQFNPDFANRFAALVKDFEVRVDGKLIGYKVPVQPLINNLRTQMKAEQPQREFKRLAHEPQPGAAAPTSAREGIEVSPASQPADMPQAGIPSQAGSSGSEGREDYSTLFGTLGLPNLVI